MKILDWVLDLLFPRKCVLCGKLLQKDETDFCRSCRVETEEYPEGKTKIQFLDSFHAVWYYKGYVRRSLLRYKFHGCRGFADAYGRMVAMKVSTSCPEGFELLTWVPVSRARKFRRGYDQVELLARAVGRELGMTPVPLLRKIRNNRPQSGISGAAQRRANVLGAYVLTGKADVRGKRILLLDDILTTGATAGECGRMLLTAGAGEVHCAVVAAARE